MPTRRALIAALAAGSAGCGSRREWSDQVSDPPPMDYEPRTPSTPTPRASPLPIDQSFRWPAPFYDAANTCRVPTTGPAEEPALEWEVWLPDGGRASHALIDGRWLYVLGRRRLWAIDRRQGWLARTVSLPVEVRTAPSLAGDAVVFGTWDADGRGVASVSVDGRLRWRHDEYATSVPPAVHDGTVYAVYDDELVAADLANGAVAWRHRADEGDRFVTLPAVGSDAVTLHGAEGRTYAVAAETGERGWRHATGSGDPPTVVPTLDESLVYGGFGEGTGTLVLGRGSGDLAWTTERPTPVGTHGLGGERVVGVTDAGSVFALSRGRGTLKWDVEGGAGRPVVAGETVYVRGARASDGIERLVALSLADGSRRWERPVDGDGWLLVADGYCYLSRGDGVIQCLG